MTNCMKYIIRHITLILFILTYSCSEDKTEKKYNKTEINNPCKSSKIALDTNNELQGQIFNVEIENLMEYKIYSIHTSVGQGELGYAVFYKNKTYVLCLIEGFENKHKIIGTLKIPPIKKNEDIVFGCQANCDSNFMDFSLVREIKKGEIKTLKAWRINDRKRQLEEISSLQVNCNEAFYRDLD